MHRLFKVAAAGAVMFGLMAGSGAYSRRTSRSSG